MRKLISLTLMLVVLLCAAPAAYATEVTEPIEGSTPSVKTLDELQAAIEAADDGDQIQILDSIVFDSGEYCIGASDKTVELLYDKYSGGRDLFVVNTAATRITLQNISIIGNGLDCDSVLETSLMSQEVLLSNVTIQGLSCLYPICNTGVMEIKNCSFIDNNGRYGGHIRNERGTLTVSGSTFVGGKTEGSGGAIYSLATLTVSDSVFENNYANFGGAICSLGNSEIRNSRIINNTARYYSGGVLNSGLTSYSMVITDCEIYGNTANDYADDISNYTKITIQYTKDIPDIYTTTDRIPHGWQSDSPENRKGITDIVGYDIPIISTQAVGESVHLRFAFEDEIKEDNADDTTPTTPEDTPPEPSEPENTEPTTPSEPDVTEPTTPGEAEITEPTTPSEPSTSDPTSPSEPETTEPDSPNEPDNSDPVLPTEPEATDPTQEETDHTETEPGKLNRPKHPRQEPLREKQIQKSRQKQRQTKRCLPKKALCRPRHPMMSPLQRNLTKRKAHNLLYQRTQLFPQKIPPCRMAVKIHLMIQMRQMIQKQPPHQPEVQRIPHLQSQGIPKIYTPLSQNRQKFQQFLLLEMMQSLLNLGAQWIPLLLFRMT